MRRVLMLAALAGCGGTLAPGETECTTASVFGTMQTRCETGQPAQPTRTLVQETDAARPPRVVAEGNHPLFCAFVVGEAGSGMCFPDEGRCDRFNERDHGPTRYSDCERRSAGACFTANIVLDKSRITICAPTISDCESRLRYARSNPDYAVAAMQCEIYRQKATGGG